MADSRRMVVVVGAVAVLSAAGCRQSLDGGWAGVVHFAACHGCRAAQRYPEDFRPEVDFLHVRSETAGCFTFAVTSHGGQGLG